MNYEYEDWDEWNEHPEEYETEFKYGSYTGDYAEWARDYDRDRM